MRLMFTAGGYLMVAFAYTRIAATLVPAITKVRREPRLPTIGELRRAS